MPNSSPPPQPTQREYWNSRVGDEWAAHADRIDAMFRPITEAVLAASVFQPGERVVDIGCGAGDTTVEIARRVGAGGAVAGIDLSSQLLALARRRNEASGLAIDFMEGDAGAITLDNSFDIAFSRFGVMFFEEPTLAFTNIRRMMRRNGRLVFVCWRPLHENPSASLPIEAIEPMLTAPLPAPDPDSPGPYALSDAGRIERILEDAKWNTVVVTAWDGHILIGGGGTLDDTADFMLKIGPCARAIAAHDLNPAEARRLLFDRLSPLHKPDGVLLPAACWIVTARA